MDVERSHSRNIFSKGFIPLEEAADFSPVRNDICLRQMSNGGRKRSSLTGFTISEVLICVVIILILATLAIAGYSQVLDNAYQRVCATNQTIIMRGIERHFLTTGIAPATLGDIELEYWKDAYAEVMKNRDWQTKLSYFLVKITTAKEACADITKLEDLVNPVEMKVYGIMPDVFHCPANKTPGGPSYGINVALKNYDRWSNVPADMSLIADCTGYSFSSEDNFSFRHKMKLGQERVAQAITKSMQVKKHKKGKDVLHILPLLPSTTTGPDSEQTLSSLTNTEMSEYQQLLTAALQRREGYVQILEAPNSNIGEKIYAGLSLSIVDIKIAYYKSRLGI